jgi:hypothetical protein
MADFIHQIKEIIKDYEKTNISIYDFHDKLYEIFIEMDKNLSFSAKIKKLLKIEEVFIDNCINESKDINKDKIYNIFKNLIFYENRRPQQVSINSKDLNIHEKACVDKIFKKIFFAESEFSDLYSWLK